MSGSRAELRIFGQINGPFIVAIYLLILFRASQAREQSVEAKVPAVMHCQATGILPPYC